MARVAPQVAHPRMHAALHSPTALRTLVGAALMGAWCVPERTRQCHVFAASRDVRSLEARAVVLLGVLGTLPPCGPHDPPASGAPPTPRDTPASSTPDVQAYAPRDAGAAPLAGEWLVALPPPVDAWVAVPLGATAARPVVAGIHGAGDRPDWSCAEWLASTGGYAFVVCPRGVPATWKDTWAWGSAESIAVRLERALVEVRARYGAYVSEGPLVYGGWSQGATLASSVVRARPGLFDRAVLVEIGYTALDIDAVARDLRVGGVERAIVSCSSTACRTFASDARRPFARSGIALRVTDVGLRGHWFDEPVFRVLGAAFPWLTEGDARWQGVELAVERRNAAR